MNILRSLAAALCILALSACSIAPTVNPSDPHAVRSNIDVIRDDFKKVTTYEGPNAVDRPDLLFIRARKSDGGSLAYQIYVSYIYREANPHLYDEAYDSNGNRLSLTRISREVFSCSSSYSCTYNEQVGLDVTRQYLEQSRHTGIRFKVSGKGGETIFALPPAYIVGFLSAVNGTQVSAPMSRQQPAAAIPAGQADPLSGVRSKCNRDLDAAGITRNRETLFERCVDAETRRLRDQGLIR